MYVHFEIRVFRRVETVSCNEKDFPCSTELFLKSGVHGKGGFLSRGVVTILCSSETHSPKAQSRNHLKSDVRSIPKFSV